MHPHMLRHTFVTTMLDAGVDLRDTQIAARHADPRTTMRYHRAGANLDRHPNYILAAYMSSGTRTALFCRMARVTRAHSDSVGGMIIRGEQAVGIAECVGRSAPGSPTMRASAPC
jgi:hypothetical protein